jgi:SAM-dependent methyltransferase
MTGPTVCILCSSERSTAAFAQPSPIRRCTNCGLVVTSGGRAATPAYGDEYFSGGGYHSYFARAGQWRHEAKRRLRWLLGATSPRRVLEIGCAGGFFLEAARAAGIEALGVESSEPAARYAGETVGVPIVLGRFEEADLDRLFDAVCAFHVLEHVVDPKALLEKARTIMAPGGWLALEVPNIDSAAARADGLDWPGLQPAYHRWHFSPRTLARLIGVTGFRVVRCDTVFARFYARPIQGLRGALGELRTAARLGSLRTVHPSLGDHVRLLARSLP